MNTLLDTQPIADEYEQWLTSWASPETVHTRAKLARRLLVDWTPADFTPDNIQTWIGRHKPGWTRVTYCNTITSLCEWMTAAGYLTEDPMPMVRRPARPVPVPRPLTDREVERVLAVAEGVERDWFRIGLLTGLRAHEIAKLHGGDVTDTLLYVEGKGGKRAALPLHPEVRLIADRYPADGYWFPSPFHPGEPIGPTAVSQRIRGLFRTVGVAGSIHRARHTYATRLLRSGVNIRTVQQLMRHSSLTSTQVYTAVTDADMREAIHGLSA